MTKVTPIHKPANDKVAQEASQNSMRSTWRHGDRSSWSLAHRLFDIFDLYPTVANKPVPVFTKMDKIPHMPEWCGHVFVWLYALLPMLMHQMLLTFGQIDSIHPVVGYAIYAAGTHALGWGAVRALKKLAHAHGFLDGETVPERQNIPDSGVMRIVAGSVKTLDIRLAIITAATFQRDVAPISLLSDWTWVVSTLLKVGIYGIVIDFWFYAYHRSMHEIPWLWKYHRTHHLAKHPVSMMASWSDEEQEFLDVVGVPVLAATTMYLMGISLPFHQWFVCHLHIIYTELVGHSGVRVHSSVPNIFHRLLACFGAALTVEDHDLHHRNGYRTSGNYGKQTLLWDRVFGTARERIEMREGNIDYQNKVYMPIF